MSKTDLLKLAEEAKAILAKSEESRTEYYNKEPHSYSVNRISIIRESLVQIGLSRETISDEELTQLTKAATEYCYRLHDAFMAEKSSGITVYAKSRINFYVIINSGIDAYRKIYQVRTSENGGLRKFTNELNKIFPESKGTHSVAFDVGHTSGSSIAEKRIQDALKMFTTIPRITGEGSRAINKVISIAIRSHEKVDLNKAIYITVIDESSTENRRKGSVDEKKWIKETRIALDNMIKKVDWANQRGSRSTVEAVISTLLSTSKKSKAKISGKITTKSSPSKADTKLIIKGKSPKNIKSDLVGTLNIPAKKDTGYTNWNSLVSIINSKLPKQIIDNMGTPRLNNRTGTFANSAKVIKVDTTKDGYPSLTFNYKRNPYDVFDKTLGKSPWNTTERDPRALVEKSIREIVQEMAIGRFYTRRA